MLFAFAPIVKFLVSGAAGLEVPFSVLLYSVLVFVVIPLAWLRQPRVFLRTKGPAWFSNRLLPPSSP